MHPIQTCEGMLFQMHTNAANFHFISQQSFIKPLMTDRKPWTKEEDAVILTLIQQLGTSQWTAIASEMRVLCSSARSSKQIRERWYNQLSPDIAHTSWSTQEQALLFQSHERFGNRWKDIAVLLAGRTDNAVKNHFYSTVRRALRRMDKHFGFKDSTKKIRNLKPAALTHLLEATRSLPDFSELMDLLLKFAQWKPKRRNYQVEPQNGRQVYNSIINMISEYNQHYERSSKQHSISSKSTKQQEESQPHHQHSNDKQSTVSDRHESSQLEENQSANYFGKSDVPGNWFSVDYELDLCVKGLGLLCEQDNCE